MAKLLVNPTSSSRREIPLARTLISIGRDPSNDVVLPDAMVSRRHAVVEYRGNQYFLRDCNSSNGSLVNGDKVSERGLRDGDLVAIGTARLLFREEPEVESGAKVVHHPSAPRLRCPSCAADHRQGDQFCRQCGAALAASLPPKAVCASCGTVVPLPARFCTACGKALPDDGEPVPDQDPPTDPASDPSMEAAAAEPARPPEPIAPRGPTWPPLAQGSAAVSAAPRLDPPVTFVAPAPRPAPETPPLRRALPRPAPTAGFAARLAALSVDCGILGALSLLVASPAAAYWTLRDVTSEPPFLAVFLTLSLVPVALAVAALYYVYFWGLVGSTPGKRLLGLSVQEEDGSEPIGTPRAAMRLFGYFLSSALLGAGFLMALSGGRALHDRLAGTRVVRRSRR